MADALASGASVRKDVGVQVPPRAPLGLPRKRGGDHQLVKKFGNLQELGCITTLLVVLMMMT